MKTRSIGVKGQIRSVGTYFVFLELEIAHFVHKQRFVCGMEEGHRGEPVSLSECVTVDE